MHKEKVLREIRWDVNENGTVAGRFMTYSVVLVDGDARTALEKETVECQSGDLDAFFEQSVAESGNEAREAHAQIAQMQAVVAQKDKIISIKDLFIENLRSYITLFLDETAKLHARYEAGKLTYEEAVSLASQEGVQ